MMPIREQFDADQIKPYEPTEYMTDENRFALPCSICRNEYYVDQAMLNRLNRTAEEDPESAFVCQACEAAFDELAHG